MLHRKCMGNFFQATTSGFKGPIEALTAYSIRKCLCRHAIRNRTMHAMEATQRKLAAFST